MDKNKKTKHPLTLNPKKKSGYYYSYYGRKPLARITDNAARSARERDKD